MLGARSRLGLVFASGVALLASGCTPADTLGRDAGGLDGGDDVDGRAPDAPVAPDATSFDAAVPDATPPDAPPPGPLRVLFVGDRYTADHDLPELVSRIAATAVEPVTLELESIIVDGATLRDHLTTTGARARIRDGGFDVVVIQAESTEPLRPDSEFEISAAALDQEVLASGARLVWFVTWALRAGHPDYALPYLVDPRQMTYALDGAYDFDYVLDGRLVLQHGIRAHVGIAFRLAGLEHPDVELYAGDGSHPSAAGSLLAGCVLTQMIAGITPRAPDPLPAGIDPGVADALCAIADRVACPGGATFCGGECVSLATDALHCGACGNVCPGDFPCFEARCQCREPELSPCPGRVCRHLSVDEESCGACGVACEMGQLCEASACVCQPASREEPARSTLTELRPGCGPDTEPWQPECFVAASEHCASSSCFDAGVGPTMLGAVTCVRADRRTVSYASLTARVAECTGPDVVTSAGCVTAIHRACAATGAVSGFGPIAAGDDASSLEIACVSSATLVTTSFALLARNWPRCDGTTARGGTDCAFASDQYCSRGGHYAGGYGPVEAAGDMATIVCLGGDAP
jgi:hypothetical protein